MATATNESGSISRPARLLDGGDDGMKRCKRCSLTYLPSKSSSALKLTYCSFFCELGDLGFSMDSLERMEQREASDDVPEENPALP
jgi:hypothetical protein